MLTVLSMSFLAHAEDLQVQVSIPGAAPVWALFPGVAPGSRHEANFSVDRRTHYRLTADVGEPSDGFDWQIAFDLSEVKRSRNGKATEVEMLVRPAMQAHGNALAQFTWGSTSAIEGSDPVAYTFHGYVIDWIVLPTQEARGEAQPLRQESTQ